MTTWDLDRMRYTIRKITGKYDTGQLPDASPVLPVSINNPPGIDDYINDFYLLDMPEHLRLLKLETYYQFTCVPNVDTYPVDQTYLEVVPPVYIDNYQGGWYQSPEQFKRLWPDFDFIEQGVFTSDGTNAYNFTLSQTPVLQGSVTIGAPSNSLGVFETFTDQAASGAFVNPGVLTGSLGGAGTIDYITGVVTLNFFAPVTAGVSFNCHYYPYIASRPRDVLFFNQSLCLRPVPQDTYQIKMIAYVQPTVAIANSTATRTQFIGVGTDSTLFNEWWQMVAYGAALKILIEDGDLEEADRYKGVFEEQKLLAQRRTIKQLVNQRIPTEYSQVGTGPSFPVYPVY